MFSYDVWYMRRMDDCPNFKGAIRVWDGAKLLMPYLKGFMIAPMHRWNNDDCKDVTLSVVSETFETFDQIFEHLKLLSITNYNFLYDLIYYYPIPYWDINTDTIRLHEDYWKVLFATTPKKVNTNV